MKAEEKEQVSPTKHEFHLHRKLFLLVFAVALLWQAVLGLNQWINGYAFELQSSFKAILTVNGETDNRQLNELGEKLNQNNDIVSVQLFSPQDAFLAVSKQNPQLVQALLLMGKNKMPAYFEITLTPQAIHNVVPFMENLAAEYSSLTPHYNAQHAQFSFYATTCAKLLRVLISVTLFIFLLFMFLIEAAPSDRVVSHSLGGAVSGVLAGILSALLMVGIIYPLGILSPTIAAFTTFEIQALLLAFCGLLGWSLSKWQRF